MGLDVVRTLLLRVVGLRVNAKARKVAVNYRFIFMKPSEAELAQIALLVAKGVIKPVVDRIFPTSECQSAIEYSASGRVRGKVVISCDRLTRVTRTSRLQIPADFFEKIEHALNKWVGIFSRP
jgi:Zinc-binding dehydrogenase